MKRKLEDILDIPLLQKLLDSLNEALFFPSAIIDIDGKILTGSNWQDICTKFHRVYPESEKECKISDKYIEDHIADGKQQVKYRCPHGMIDTATQIVIDGEHLGNFFTGQLFIDKPDLEFFKAQAKKYNFNEESYLDAVSRVPIFSEEQLEKNLKFITLFVEILSDMGLKNLRDKESERVIIEKEERLRFALGSANIGLFEIDVQTGLMICNSEFALILGYDANKFETSIEMWKTLLHPEDKEKAIENLENYLSGKLPNYISEFRLRTRSGNWKWLLSRGKIHRHLETGEQVRMIGVLLDINERKISEETHRINKEYYKSVLKTAMDGYWVVNMEGEILEVNDAYCKMIGYTRDELLTMSIHDVEALEDEILVKRHMDRLISKGSDRFESNHKCKSCKIINVEISTTFMRDSEKMFAFIRDISEKKRAETQLIESEKKYRIIADNTYDWEFWLAPDLRYEYISPSCERITGYTAEQFRRNAQIMSEIIHPDDKEIFSEHMHDSLTKHLPGEVIFKIIRKDGDERWIEHICQPIFDEKQNFLGNRGSNRDITRRKNSEEAKKSAEKKYKYIFENAVEGIYQTTPDGKFLTANPALAKILGYNSPEELIDNIKNIGTELYVDPLQRNAIFNKIREDGRVNNFECHLYRKDRTKIWVSLSTHAVFDSYGSLLYAEGNLIDITERKQSYIILRESEEKFYNIFNYSSNAISFSEAETEKFVDVNQTWIDLSGYSREFAIGKTATELKLWITPDDHKKCLDELKLKGQIQNFEIKLLMKSKILTFQLSAESIMLKDKKFVLWEFKNITDTKQIENELWKSTAEVLDLYHNAPCGYHSLNNQGEFVNINNTELLWLGYSREEIIGEKLLNFITPEYFGKFVDGFKKFKEEGIIHDLEIEMIKKDGSILPVLLNSTSIKDENNQFIMSRTILLDISERRHSEEEKRKLENQYNQSQKMEAVGRLAGGIAHDLNNLLTPIIGYSEMIMKSLDKDNKNSTFAQRTYQAAERARDLVKQLLAFSRKQTLEFKSIDLNNAIIGFEKLLRRMIHEDIQIKLNLSSKTQKIKGDLGQLEQVIMNLAINAQDAMMGGGLLTIETRDFSFEDSAVAASHDLIPGRYVILLVSDTGHGMNSETLSHVFEPFYTTKEEGKGTGLGLATVYGIVKQHEGNITVYSEPDLGTTFKIYLPIIKDEFRIEEQILPGDKDTGGDETIMVVEDNEMVRDLSVEILKNYGYEVYSASDGNECLKFLSELNEPPDLVLTDVVMPDMNGKVLYEQITKIFPDVKVLYMSGYTQDVITHRGILDEGIAFIHKPFTSEELTSKVRGILDNII